jgi:hypothetical protein
MLVMVVKGSGEQPITQCSRYIAVVISDTINIILFYSYLKFGVKITIN